MKSLISFLLLPFLLVASTQAYAQPAKQVVGATETVLIIEAGLNFKARIDTGAKTSSIHAENIQITSMPYMKSDSLNQYKNAVLGQPISFDVGTQNGVRKQIKTKVLSIVKVKTSDYSEYRYVVPLTVILNGKEKPIAVTLNNRSKVTYRLLLGRNWLQGDYLVDVDLNSLD